MKQKRILRDLCCVFVVELRDRLVKFHFLVADAGQSELRLSFTELYGWPLGPERRQSIATLDISAGDLPIFFIITSGSLMLASIPIYGETTT